MANPFFTVGHATRSLSDFISLLQLASIQHLIDVRSVPRSRTNPQFNRDTLPQSLMVTQIGYDHMAELGGLRKRQFREASPNSFWENDSFRNYADYATSEPFRSGLARLRELGQERRCVVMCAEMVWWRCHRRIIADYLIASGEAVFHLMGQDRIEPARMTEAAQLRSDGIIIYPAED